MAERNRSHITITRPAAVEDYTPIGLAGKGVFAAWEDPEFFAGVYIGPLDGISWSERIDLCPDAVYMRLTGTLDKCVGA